MTKILGKLSGAVVLDYGFTVLILSAGSVAFGFVVRQTDHHGGNHVGEAKPFTILHLESSKRVDCGASIFSLMACPQWPDFLPLFHLNVPPLSSITSLMTKPFACVCLGNGI